MDPWMMAQFGLQLFSGMSASAARKRQIEAQGIIDVANAEAANTVREANNATSAATSSLMNFARSINNKRAGEAGGAKVNAIRVNAGRVMDRLLKGGLQEQLAASEQMGQVAVAAAAAGVGGGSIDAVKRTMALRRGIQQEQLERAQVQTREDFNAQEKAAMSDLVGSVDIATSVASLDYGVSQPPLRYLPNVLQDTIFNPKLDLTLVRDGLFKSPADTRAAREGGYDYFLSDKPVAPKL